MGGVDSMQVPESLLSCCAKCPEGPCHPFVMGAAVCPPDLETSLLCTRPTHCFGPLPTSGRLHHRAPGGPQHAACHRPGQGLWNPDPACGELDGEGRGGDLPALLGPPVHFWPVSLRFQTSAHVSSAGLEAVPSRGPLGWGFQPHACTQAAEAGQACPLWIEHRDLVGHGVGGFPASKRSKSLPLTPSALSGQNADDPEAVYHAFRVAADFRSRFHKDIVVDIVGYRRVHERMVPRMTDQRDPDA